MSLKVVFAVNPRNRTAERTLAALFLCALLSACGGSKDKPSSQVAAKVNKEELSVHQINHALQRQPGLRPEQVGAASRQVLERLIDQELALQKAEEGKLDREPRVQQAVEAARREIIARSYTEKVSESAPKPSAEEIRKYYMDHPALFAGRRIYSFQELAIEAKPEQIAALQQRLAVTKNFGEFTAYLEASGLRFSNNQVVRAAEQLPLANLHRIAQMKDGESSFNATSNGAQVVVLLSTRSQPVDEQRAQPAVEQFLLNERKRKIVEDDRKALRAAAKIEYVGEFAQLAASAPRSAAPPQAPASSGLDIEQGLKGLK